MRTEGVSNRHRLRPRPFPHLATLLCLAAVACGDVAEEEAPDAENELTDAPVVDTIRLGVDSKGQEVAMGGRFRVV